MSNKTKLYSSQSLKFGQSERGKKVVNVKKGASDTSYYVSTWIGSVLELCRLSQSLVWSSPLKSCELCCRRTGCLRFVPFTCTWTDPVQQRTVLGGGGAQQYGKLKIPALAPAAPLQRDPWNCSPWLASSCWHIEARKLPEGFLSFGHN